jgi:maltooligosyltrehalose trehalohydrolase
MEVHMVSPRERMIPMEAVERGYFVAEIAGIEPGALYRYRLDGEAERPDPVSRFQPQGVHGPSEVVGQQFPWSDSSWHGLSLRDYVIYELHVGTFTEEGTFDAIIPRLPALKSLGITAIEIMPVAQFPGSRNWGYDGVYAFAVQDSYGGPAGLKRLVDACHQHGMAVVLDVVYNHLGPEGNYLPQFGFYFTDMYKTPWGEALNFEQAHSDEVRRYFIENALYWITDFHVDGLRLDAIHAIVDPSARPFVQELAAACHSRAKQFNREVQIIAESNRNDRRVVSSLEQGGWGLDSEWNDDFHHSLRVAITGEQEGYYQDFNGLEDLALSFREGFAYSGRYSKYRQRSYGNSSADLSGEKLVVFSQNHDQVGNRKLGDRLSASVSFEQLKLAAASVLLSPFVPLLFMGEEYGELAPFQYFVSHGDASLIEAVRKGRQEEFSSFEWQGELPDPQDEETFRRSKLNWEVRTTGKHLILRNYYRELLRLRRETPALGSLDKKRQKVTLLKAQNVFWVHRWEGEGGAIALFHFGDDRVQIEMQFPKGSWVRMLDSAEDHWNGPEQKAQGGNAHSGAVRLQIEPWSALLFISSVSSE